MSDSYYEVEGSLEFGLRFTNRNTAIDNAIEINAKRICFYNAEAKSTVDVSVDMARVWVDNFKAENNNEMPAIFPDFVAKHLPKEWFSPPSAPAEPEPETFTDKLIGLGAPLAAVHMPLPPLRAPKNIEHATLMLNSDKAKLEDELAAANARVLELESAEKIKELDVLCKNLNEVMYGECSYQPEDKFHIFIDGAINGSTYFVPHKQSLDGLIEAFDVMIKFEGASYRQGAVGIFTSYIN